MQNWAALCWEVSGALPALMACMLRVVYDSSLFRGLVSSWLPTESVLAWNAHYSDISTTLCWQRAFNISTGYTQVSSHEYTIKGLSHQAPDFCYWIPLLTDIYMVMWVHLCLIFFCKLFCSCITILLLTDTDECDQDRDNCHVNATCGVGMIGSFLCTCNHGFEGDGINCTSMNPFLCCSRWMW